MKFTAKVHKKYNFTKCFLNSKVSKANKYGKVYD